MDTASRPNTWDPTNKKHSHIVRSQPKNIIKENNKHTVQIHALSAQKPWISSEGKWILNNPCDYTYTVHVGHADYRVSINLATSVTESRL